MFGLWVAPLIAVFVFYRGWSEPTHFVNDTVNYTEPIIVVVIMVAGVDASDRVARRGSARARCDARRWHAGGMRWTGGGLTAIANAQNPAGLAFLARYLDGAVERLRLFPGRSGTNADSRRGLPVDLID